MPRLGIFTKNTGLRALLIMIDRVVKSLLPLWTVVLLLVSAAGSRPESAQPGDILLITVDTLRPDHLGIFGYARPTSPNLDRIFEDAAIFERTYSTHASTPPSVDIAPTVLAFAEGRVPSSLPGIDLRQEQGREDRVVYTRAWTLDSHITAAVGATSKWVIERRTVEGKAT